MFIKQKETEVAEHDRATLDERVSTTAVSGQKLIVTGVALAAGAMILYGVAAKNNFFGAMEEKQPEKKVVATKEGDVKAGPKAPAIIIPDIMPQEKKEPTPQEIEAESTLCPGNLRLPKGMPCPGDATGQMKMDTANAPSQPASQNKPAIDPIRQRRLSGEINMGSGLMNTANAAGNGTGSGDYKSINGEGFLGDLAGSNKDKPVQGGNGLTDMMPATYTPKVAASINLNPSMTLLKGTMPDCTLAVAVRSGVPGFIKCNLSQEVRSMDGKIVLLERGTQVEGEYRAGVAAGNRALFAIFTRAVSPNGVIAQFDSPATDALGRAGLDGQIDNKWMERFGGAIMSAIIEDAVDIYKKSDTSGNGNVVSQFPNTNSSGKAVTDEMLKQGSRAQPELLKNQGEIVKIFVARDIDFSTVYELKRASTK
jgi:type IV secretion system protein VirB10